MKFKSVAKLNGEITIKNTQNEEVCTTAMIKRGKLIEKLEVIFRRLYNFDESIVHGCKDGEEYILTDENHFTIIGPLIAEHTYFLSISQPEINNSSIYLCKPLQKSDSELEKNNTKIVWAYDKRVLLHESEERLWVESPYRLEKSINKLMSCERVLELVPSELLNLLSDEGESNELNWKQNNVRKDCRAAYVKPRLASLEEICLVHTESIYEEFIKKGKALKGIPSDVYCNDNGGSALAVRAAAASVIDVAKIVATARNRFSSTYHNLAKESLKICNCISKTHANDNTIGLCLIRPPGHHCKPNGPSGFCLVNNVSIGAEYLLRDCMHEILEQEHENRFYFDCVMETKKTRILRVAIVDLDVHFGDGTATYVDTYKSQKAENNNSSNNSSDEEYKHPLLYLSIHRYDDGKFYPFDKRGASSFTGSNVSECLCNVGVNTRANEPEFCYEVISDLLMEQVVKEIFIPRLSLFDPDVIFVSLGFDAIYGDPLGKMAVVNGLTNALKILKNWCLERNVESHCTHESYKESCYSPVGLIVVLEGGYNPENVSNGVVSAAYALTFPYNDVDVQLLTEVKIPPTWKELRERQQRDAKRSHYELEEKEVDITTERYTNKIDDDTTLLSKHREWCRQLIDEWNKEHNVIRCNSDSDTYE